MSIYVLFILSVNFEYIVRCALIYFLSSQNNFPGHCSSVDKTSKGMSACTSRTSKYWIIKYVGGAFSFQLSACRLRRPIRVFLPYESRVARRVTPKLHVCAKTGASSQLIACDSSQSPGHWSIITLWSEWMSASMPAERGEEAKHWTVILHRCKDATVLAQRALPLISDILSNKKQDAGQQLCWFYRQLRQL